MYPRRSMDGCFNLYTENPLIFLQFTVPTTYKPHHNPIQIRLSYAITRTITLRTIVTILTAHQFVINPKGPYANSCRSSIEFLECIWKICYNLYHYRLGEIPDVVCAIDDVEEEYSEQELAKMQ